MIEEITVDEQVAEVKAVSAHTRHVTKYKTRDGRIYNKYEKQQAEAHERQLEFYDWLETQVILLDDEEEKWLLVNDILDLNILAEKLKSVNFEFPSNKRPFSFPAFVKWWTEYNDNGRDWYEVAFITKEKLSEFIAASETYTKEKPYQIGGY